MPLVHQQELLLVHLQQQELLLMRLQQQERNVAAKPQKMLVRLDKIQKC